MINIKKTIKILAIMLILSANSLSAHYLWVNALKSGKQHNNPQIMLSLGWGHTLPFGDSTNSINGRIAIDSFELIQPDGKAIALEKPEFKLDKPIAQTSEYELFNVDRPIIKLKHKKEAKKGMYTLVTKSKPTYYTMYIDEKGKKRFKLKSIDMLKDVKKVLGSFKYQAFGKSYMNVGKWEKPKPLGTGLEIIPLNDLSNIKVGDLVEFEVLFFGKLLDANPLKSMDYATAYGHSFGQNDKFALFSYITKGKASFRVQSSGQWIINVAHKEPVTKDNFLKDEYGKTTSVYHGSTLTFTVK